MGLGGTELGKSSETNLPGLAYVRHGNRLKTEFYESI